jgi:hypothetical protein
MWPRVVDSSAAGGLEDVGDPPVEALDQPKGLWAAGGFALALGGEAVGELLAVVGEDLLDLERARRRPPPIFSMTSSLRRRAYSGLQS